MLGSSDHARLDDLVAEWLRLDRNETTRQEIRALHTAKRYDQLDLLLSQRIAFGTAGLRARMQAGFSRMNDLTVLQATQGLCAYILEKIPDVPSKPVGVVIGHDHRHNSARFARLAARVFIRSGIKTMLFRGLVHTPMVPFATKRLGAAAGLMITASHNPAADNGYKVYYSNAVQIIPPHDKGIAASIERNLEVSEDAWSVEEVEANSLCLDSTEEMKAAYFEMVQSLATTSPDIRSESPLVFTYTPMHGVGLPFAMKSFTEAYSFPASAFVPVHEQQDPDPEFPTVRFPNPEEKGALKLAMEEAESGMASRGKATALVLANDPDADRFCAAEYANGKWQVFSGDQIGAILGVRTFEQYKASGKPLSKLAMLASTVSSKLLRAAAEKEGFLFRETLTGFKYLGNAALELESRGYFVPFAYEEAIGYMCGPYIRDKDGITALLAWAELATELARKGESIGDYLEEIYQRYGHFVTSNSYFICHDPATIDVVFSRLRFGVDSTPDLVAGDLLAHLKLPQTLAGYPVSSFRDLTIGYDSSNPPLFEPTLPVSRSSHMITFVIGGNRGQVVGTIRTSGTEPKVKYYLECTAPIKEDAIGKLAEVERALGVEWLRWQESGFSKPAS